jgi:hypothetical protein
MAMSAAENIFGQLAQQETQRISHDQSIAAPASNPSAEDIFSHMAANNGQPPPTAAGAKPSGLTDVLGRPVNDANLPVKSAEPQGPTISATPRGPMTVPFARVLMDAVDKLRQAQDFTQEGKQGHPVQAKIGEIANQIEGFLFGNETHGEAAIGSGKTGILTNPVTGSLIPGGEGAPMAAEALESGANFLKGGVQTVREALAGGKAGEGAAEATHALNPKTGIIEKIVKGEKVAQAPAKAAIRGAAGAEDEAALLEGNKTVLDEPLKGIAQKEKAAYQKMDTAAGFDVKAERATLANDEYKLKQLGNTEADQTAREKLTASIEDSKKRLGEAEKKMGEAGVDTKEADTLHKQRMAGQEFKKALIQHVSPDGESVNVDGLLNASKKLRFSKYGDRLEQFMGSKEKADAFMEELQEAQEAGVHALKMRELGKTALKVLGGLGAVGTGAGAIAHVLKE